MNKTIIKVIKNGILNLIFPRRCVICNEILEVNRISIGYCKKCYKKLRFCDEPICMKCGKPMKSSFEEFCYDCKRKRHYFEQARSVYIYKGEIKKSIYRFKYNNKRYYKEAFARDAVRMFGNWILSKNIDAIIAVPMYKKKEKIRGYNQASLFAKELSDNLGIKFYDDLVIRTRNTVPMKELSDVEREKNLKNAFNFTKKGLQLKKVLVVDDIYTTGVTLDMVAKCLIDSGIEKVYGMCVCVGIGYTS